MFFPRSAVLALTALIVGCTTSVPVNEPLGSGKSNEDQHDFLTPEATTDRPIVLMAFSGGGSRASMMALSVLQEIRSYTYVINGGARRLVDDVRAVSSVSGGSVTAAYFAWKGPDKVDDLLPKFLAKDNMAALEWEAVSPVTWFRLAFTKFTRVEAFRDLLDKELFQEGGDSENVTFNTINASDKPILLLNSTDMSSGQVFAFTSRRFNDICSDLGSLPLSAGVAASANFPIALSPMMFKNFSVGCQGKPRTEPWVEKALIEPYYPYQYPEKFARARYADSLRHPKTGYRDIEYIYVIDGGVADNSGSRSLLELIIDDSAAGHLIAAINANLVKRLVVISVNARSDRPNTFDHEPSIPGVIAAIGSVTSVPIDSATASVNAQIQDGEYFLSTQRLLAPAGAGIKNVDLYDIALDFDQLSDDPTHLRDRVKDIDTTWTLSADDLRTIDQASRLLVRQNPCLQKLLQDLGVTRAFIQPARAAACATKPN